MHRWKTINNKNNNFFLKDINKKDIIAISLWNKFSIVLLYYNFDFILFFCVSFLYLYLFYFFPLLSSNIDHIIIAVIKHYFSVYYFLCDIIITYTLFSEYLNSNYYFKTRFQSKDWVSLHPGKLRCWKWISRKCL